MQREGLGSLSAAGGLGLGSLSATGGMSTIYHSVDIWQIWKIFHFGPFWTCIALACQTCRDPELRAAIYFCPMPMFRWGKPMWKKVSRDNGTPSYTIVIGGGLITLASLPGTTIANIAALYGKLTVNTM